ncbi:MAG: hypothetical protein AB7Q27_10965 [Acidimicrobiia bacterium]
MAHRPDTGGLPFATVRKGFDPDQVRSHIRSLEQERSSLADRIEQLERELEQARHDAIPLEDLDEAEVSKRLGEEAARVLTTAHQAASQMRTRAEEHVHRTLKEAEDEATRIRSAAEVAAAHHRQEAESSADAHLESVKQQGREMLAEAHAVRERILSDLARRREAGRRQLEQLKIGRDRLLAAYDVARRSLITVTEELSRSVPEAQALAGGALSRPLTDAVYDGDDLLAGLDRQVTGEVAVIAAVNAGSVPSEWADAPEALPSDVAPEPVVPEPVAAAVTVVTESAPIFDIESMEPDVSHAPVDVTEHVTHDEPEALAQDESWTPDLPEVEPVTDEAQAEAPSVVDEVETDATAADEAAADEAAADETAADAAMADEAPEPDDGPGDGRRNADGSPVDDLFARLRAQRVEAVATARVVLADEPTERSHAAVAVRDVIDVTDAGSIAEPAATAGATDVVEVIDDETLAATEPPELAVRRAELGIVEKTLARHLKRALADEQNDVFDRLRRTAPTPAPDVVFGSEIDHLDRYRAAVEADVRSAAMAGARRGGASPLDANAVIDRARVVDAVLAEVAIDVAGPLRARLLDSLALAGQDCEEATSLLRAAYREWKTQRFDDLASHIVISAYELGLVAAVPAGTCMRWMIDPSGAPCPDAEDNALAGPVLAGEPFPTGHVVPPAHVGCRCHLVVD